MKKHKNKIIIGAVIAALLAFAFWYGGDAPALRGWKPQPQESVKTVQNIAAEPTKSAIPDAKPTEKENAETEQTAGELQTEEASEPAAVEGEPQNAEAAPLTEQGNSSLAEAAAKYQPQSAPEEAVEYPPQSAPEEVAEYPPQSAAEAAKYRPPFVEPVRKASAGESAVEINEASEKDEYQTEPVPKERPVPIEPQDAVISDKALTCTLSVRCDSVLDNMAWLDPEKAELVPKDGVIYAEKTVTFYEGESVFNLLLREMKQNRIHMEYESTPVYNSAYIEGIGNLYEFDCGELSGWMYRVNGWFPNYGCSRYQLMAGDRVEWVYTCDLGADVGGNYSARNGR